MIIKPLKDRVIVKVIANAPRNRPIEGKVVAIGEAEMREGNCWPVVGNTPYPNTPDDDDDPISLDDVAEVSHLQVKVGDQVLVNKYADNMVVEGGIYVVVREDDILAVIER